MKHLRQWVPVLGIFALAALFLKLPEISNFFGIFECKTCSANNPYLPLIGAGYFASLIAISLLFPSFPRSELARGGLTWALLLALVMTYMNMPTWCFACLIAHGCNILIWMIWVVVPAEANNSCTSSFRERLCLTLFIPCSVVALFSCLNLTFLVYGFKAHHSVAAAGLAPGDSIPSFNIKTIGSNSTISNTNVAQTARLVINFISSDCPYCKEQLPVLEAVATELASSSYRFVNVSPTVSSELIQHSSVIEWVEDKEGYLRELFKVTGFPTLFVIGTEGKILQVIYGVPDQLKHQLLTSLSN